MSNTTTPDCASGTSSKATASDCPSKATAAGPLCPPPVSAARHPDVLVAPKAISKPKRRRNRSNSKGKPLKIIERGELTEKQRELLASLDLFFTEEILRDIVIPVKKQRWTISLRSLDHLVTSFARPDSHNVEFYRSAEDQFPWNLYESYQKNLKYGGGKNMMDPFCRGPRIRYQKGDTEVLTTVAQLNFFRWAIMNKVLDWAVEHAAAIQADIDKEPQDAAPKLAGKKRHRSISPSRRRPMILNVHIKVTLGKNPPENNALEAPPQNAVTERPQQ